MTARAETWAEHAAASLKAAGYRQGGARQTVLDALGRQPCAVSARDVEVALRKARRTVGLASIYRTLEQLDELGLVSRVEVGDGVTRYEPRHAGGEHHHHLVCRRCGEVQPFEDAALERAIHRLSDAVDFRVDAHDVVLQGTCPRCA
jgi:Fur family ferric uptake transcriptional regulator